jgi:hypothetical protein
VAGETPIAEAMRWVSAITTVAVMMVLPGLGAQYLAELWSLPWLTPVGLVSGMALGMWYLWILVRQDTVSRSGKTADSITEEQPEDSTGDGRDRDGT